MTIHVMVAERAGGRREPRRAGARIGPARRGFAGCLAAGEGAEGEGMKARLWSSLRRRRGSCRGCMMAEEVEGRLASLEGGCRLRCGGEEGRAIACLIEGVEAGLAKKEQQRLAEEAAVAEADSSVVSLMKESTLDQHCQ